MSEQIYPRLSFDLEGTLVDLEKFHMMAFEETARKYGIEFGEKEFSNFVGAGDRAISLEITRLLGQDRPTPNEIRNEKMEVYRELLRSHSFDPRQGVGEYLEKASSWSGDLVIASLTPDEYAMLILEASHLRPFFRFILTESSVTRLKPDPEVYVKAAELLDVPPYAMLVHEDSPTGVAAAIASGSSVAAFPVHRNLAFNTPPDATFDSWVGVDPLELIEQLVAVNIWVTLR